MTSRWLSALIAAGAVSLTVQAQEPAPCATPTAVCPPATRAVTVTRVHLIEQQAATTRPKFSLREVEVGRQKQITYEIDWKEERQMVKDLVVKPRTVEQEVECTTMEPVQCVDPCTGKPCTVYKQVPVKKKVQIVINDTECVERAVIVRVPVLKPVEKEVIIKKLVLDETVEPAIRKTLRAEIVTSEVKVPIVPLPCVCP